MTRLVVTADAETDASAILDHLQREAGSRIAEHFGRRFRKAIERFVDVPEAGSPRPSLGEDVRIAIVYPYILIYEFSRADDTVTLLRVVHGRRNITRGLLGREKM